MVPRALARPASRAASPPFADVPRARNAVRLPMRLPFIGSAASAATDRDTDPDVIEAKRDDAAMLAAGQGDRRAFDRLVERHLDRTVAITTRVIGRRADAEEVTQEAFLRLWKKAEDWRPGKARVGTWLTRVALNLAIDRTRRRQPLALEEAASVADPAADGEAVIDSKQRAHAVRAAIARLPDRQRVALALFYDQDMPMSEAAAAMDISVRALESLLARARRTLKEALQGFKPREGGA